MGNRKKGENVKRVGTLEENMRERVRRKRRESDESEGGVERFTS